MTDELDKAIKEELAKGPSEPPTLPPPPPPEPLEAHPTVTLKAPAGMKAVVLGATTYRVEGGKILANPTDVRILVDTYGCTVANTPAKKGKR